MTILNETGRIWTLVAGGGASVIFADTIVELGGVKELANYGEYSGGPNEEQTYAYARTVIDLMCKHKHPEGKVTYTHHQSKELRQFNIYKMHSNFNLEF